jgi:hypothetical protein
MAGSWLAHGCGNISALSAFCHSNCCSIDCLAFVDVDCVLHLCPRQGNCDERLTRWLNFSPKRCVAGDYVSRDLCTSSARCCDTSVAGLSKLKDRRACLGKRTRRDAPSRGLSMVGEVRSSLSLEDERIAESRLEASDNMAASADDAPYSMPSDAWLASGW